MGEFDRIKYGKPKIKELLEKGYTPVDMHVHTRFSDGLMSLKSALKTAKKKGIGIAITDHQDIRAFSYLERYKFDNILIPGIEISSVEGPHVLLYFHDVSTLKEYFKKHVKRFIGKNPNSRTNMPIHDIFDSSKDYGCISAIAHPTNPFVSDFTAFIKKDKEILKKVGAVEAISGALPKHYIKKSMEFGKDLKKPIVGGTDAHTRAEIGNVVCYSYADDVESFLKNVIKKQNYVIGRTSRVSQRLKVTPTFIRHVRYPSASVFGNMKIIYNNKMRYKFRPMIGKGVNFAYEHLKNVPQHIQKIQLKK